MACHDIFARAVICTLRGTLKGEAEKRCRNNIRGSSKKNEWQLYSGKEKKGWKWVKWKSCWFVVISIWRGANYDRWHSGFFHYLLDFEVETLRTWTLLTSDQSGVKVQDCRIGPIKVAWSFQFLLIHNSFDVVYNNVRALFSLLYSSFP